MTSRMTWALLISLYATSGVAIAHSAPPDDLASYFEPTSQYRDKFGDYRSPLVRRDGSRVASPAEWRRHREELRDQWQKLLGRWPPLSESPRFEIVATEVVDGLVWTKVRIDAGIGAEPVSGYLLSPPGDGPFPAVLVVYYEPQSGVGLGVALRDYGLQLARRGFVTLSIGPPGISFQEPGGEKINSKRPYYGPVGKPVATQPLSALAYAAANCHTFLAERSHVDAARIGIIGHSFGGKWAMFASCLHEPFACAVWSDAGIVFDERHRTDNRGGSINYWDRWYLGYPLGEIATREESYRFRPIPQSSSDRTGSYKRLFAEERDLVELHALMAPRPFLVSGGSADREERWTALNHSIAVNRLLDQPHGVAMTNRAMHAPTEESNEQAYRFLEWCLLRPAATTSRAGP